jgi:hypothetical protein
MVFVYEIVSISFNYFKYSEMAAIRRIRTVVKIAQFKMAVGKKRNTNESRLKRNKDSAAD